MHEVKKKSAHVKESLLSRDIDECLQGISFPQKCLTSNPLEKKNLENVQINQAASRPKWTHKNPLRKPRNNQNMWDCETVFFVEHLWGIAQVLQV